MRAQALLRAGTDRKGEIIMTDQAKPLLDRLWKLYRVLAFGPAEGIGAA